MVKLTWKHRNNLLSRKPIKVLNSDPTLKPDGVGYCCVGDELDTTDPRAHTKPRYLTMLLHAVLVHDKVGMVRTTVIQ